MIDSRHKHFKHIPERTLPEAGENPHLRRCGIPSGGAVGRTLSTAGAVVPEETP